MTQRTVFKGADPSLALTNYGAVQDAGVLILDGDGLCYEASASAKSLPLALDKLRQKVLELMFLVGAQECRMHLTAKGSRKNMRDCLLGALPYQGNRQGKPKPPLLEILRIAAAQPGGFPEGTGVTVILHRFLEADDGMMQDAYTQPKALVVSADKDLRIVPCPWYDMQTGNVDTIQDRYGWAEFDPDKGKIVGHGTKFFWAQMLHGDQADNVKGLFSALGKRCGAVEAAEILRGCTSEDIAANTVLDLYRLIQQNPWPEAYALWLLRSDDDHVAKYITSLRISKANQEFLREQYNTGWIDYGRTETEEA